MKLDEAIKHAEEVAERLEGKEGYAHTDKTCKECAEDHRQLAEWLKELKAYKAVYEESTWRLIDANAIHFENSEFDTYSDYSRAFDAIDQAPTIKAFTLDDIEEQYRKGLEKGLEESRPHGEWIPICVSVPEKDGRYIVSLPDRGGTIMCADYLGGEWYPDDYECTSNHVIAWMPLPEPYRKEGEAE